MTKDQEILKPHCLKLMKHFDSVQIIITKHNADEGSTSCDWRGAGNQFANAAAVRAFLLQDDEDTRNSVPRRIKSEENEED